MNQKLRWNHCTSQKKKRKHTKTVDTVRIFKPFHKKSSFINGIAEEFTARGKEESINKVSISDVKRFWNGESCGERYAVGDSDYEKFAAEETNRYQLEPYIKKFADFRQFNNKDVLEIGVGFGSDHSQIARFNPKSLTGVDLTERAIENTKVRFKTLGLSSSLKTDNAENLSFEKNTFDAIYSWGVLHHSPDTAKCFDEVHRVLKPGGLAKIMIYHKHSPTGWMLWTKYALLKGKPWKGLASIYAQHLESPGTQAYTRKETQKLTDSFSSTEISIQLSFGDLLEGDVGARHKGIMLTLGKAIYPRSLIRILAKFLPIGLCLLITVRK
jgi:ubiquinone/menaquinone biosynthesis C-methylase UbiE